LISGQDKAMTAIARALHYVFKIADRKASIYFYTNILGMKVLRHEEFEERCQADCNGPYDGMWSKTMVGYGSEDEHFVLELTYNYGIKSYTNGNDFHGIYIESDEILRKLVEKGEKTSSNGDICLNDPDGHNFFIRGGSRKYPVTMVSLNITDNVQSKEFWCSICGMEIEDSTSEDRCTLSFGKDQCKLKLRLCPSIERGTAFGRIAFATPTSELKKFEERITSTNPHFIQIPLKSLDTPGKATVWVIILRDPDNHEICFVGEEAFRELCAVDPKAAKILQDAIQADNS